MTVSALTREGIATPALAPREAETLRYIAQGNTYMQTARRMGVSFHTIDTYLRRIRAKFGVYSRAEMTGLAISLQLWSPAI